MLALEVRLNRLNRTMSADSYHDVWHFHLSSAHPDRPGKALVNVGVSREHGVGTNPSFRESSVEVCQHVGASGMTAASTERRVVRGNNQRQTLPAIARGLDVLELLDKKLVLSIARYLVANNAFMLAAVREQCEDLGEGSIQPVIYAWLVQGSAIGRVEQVGKGSV